MSQKLRQFGASWPNAYQEPLAAQLLGSQPLQQTTRSTHDLRTESLQRPGFHPTRVVLEPCLVLPAVFKTATDFVVAFNRSGRATGALRGDKQGRLLDANHQC